MNRCMIDIETLGIEPGSVILSIGACRWDLDGIHDELHMSVSRESCRDAGLVEDADTLSWWQDKPDEINHILTGGIPLKDALERLAAFYGDSAEVWAFSPSFDCTHLEQAYEAVGIVEPWSYKEKRDCRTLASLEQWPDMDQEGNLHDALDDAKYQAKQTIAFLQNIHE